MKFIKISEYVKKKLILSFIFFIIGIIITINLYGNNNIFLSFVLNSIGIMIIPFVTITILGAGESITNEYILGIICLIFSILNYSLFIYILSFIEKYKKYFLGSIIIFLFIFSNLLIGLICGIGMNS
ncbi:MAG: hypothetical protein PHV23_00885 [Candidatus Gracilibacteria bacterium]|nr:hypothetical protein [Candidatus Gracilibacteria bacterium]